MAQPEKPRAGDDIRDGYMPNALSIIADPESALFMPPFVVRLLSGILKTSDEIG